MIKSLNRQKKNHALFEKTVKKLQIQLDWNLFKWSRNNYFHEIRKAKNKSWTNLLNNAKKKEVFQAYKYTKSRSDIKLLSISLNDKIKIHFEEKYDVLIEAIFSFSFEDSQKRSSKGLLFDVTNKFENRQHRRKWEKVIHRKIKNAIFSSSLKKALDSNEISFLILQKLYHAISDLFVIVFTKLIKKEYHL